MEQSVRTVVFADLTGSTALFESVGNIDATRVVTLCLQALGRNFERSGGRVVKYLGDGVLVLFDDTVAAIDACARVQEVLHNLNFGDLRHALQGVRIGIEHGVIIEQDGDCYGDAVNVASRLSDRAEPNEILMGESVVSRLNAMQRVSCHSIDRISIKGRAEPVHVWRIDWARTAESTITIPLELFEAQTRLQALQRLCLDHLDLHCEFVPPQPPLVIGRGEGVDFLVDDPRVSRRHARIEWSRGQYVLTDFSSNGTWVRFAGTSAPVMLKRDSCVLYGQGEIGLGATPDDFSAPTLRFEVVNDD